MGFRRLLALSVLSALVLSPSVAGLETISSDVSRSVTVAAQAYDAYRVTIPGDTRTVTIEFTVGPAYSDVDFYVLAQAGYDAYVDPNAPGFYYVDQMENSKSFSYSTDRSDLYFVVDNADISTTGASPTGPVTYDLAVTFETATAPSGPTATSLLLAGIAGASVFGAIAAMAIRNRRRRTPQVPSVYQQAPPYQQGLPLPPPPPDEPYPQLVGPTASSPGPVQNPGIVRRPLGDMERDALVRELSNLGSKVVGLSVFMMVLALAYLVLPNLMTMALSFLPFLGLAIAASHRKLSRAVMAGQVVEFRGVPVALGRVQNRSQTLYQMQFGTSVVGVSQGLYARFVPNRPSSLAVLEGANVAIAVDGSTVSGFERVRMGWH